MILSNSGYNKVSKKDVLEKSEVTAGIKKNRIPVWIYSDSVIQ